MLAMRTTCISVLCFSFFYQQKHPLGNRHTTDIWRCEQSVEWHVLCWQLHGFWLHPDVSGKYNDVILVQLRMRDSPLQLQLQLQLFLSESFINHRSLAVNILTKATRLHHKPGLVRSCCSMTESSKTSVRENFKQISTFCFPQKWAVSRCLKSPHNPERFHSFLIKSPLNIHHTLAQPWGNWNIAVTHFLPD